MNATTEAPSIPSVPSLAEIRVSIRAALGEARRAPEYAEMNGGRLEMRAESLGGRDPVLSAALYGLAASRWSDAGNVAASLRCDLLQQSATSGAVVEAARVWCFATFGEVTDASLAEISLPGDADWSEEV